jgi:biopolymer transport protein ExbB
MENNTGTFMGLLEETRDIWNNGGELMLPLAILALVTYTQIFSLLLYLSARRFTKVDPNLWGHWIDNPEEGKGEMGEVIRFMAKNSGSGKRLRSAAQQVRLDYLGKLPGVIKLSTVLISAAPLSGLLGTVIGMLKTFDGLSSSAGATTGLIAGGIAEALITTQAGLVIAIPGFALLAIIKNYRDELELSLIQIENSFVLKALRGIVSHQHKV